MHRSSDKNSVDGRPFAKRKLPKQKRSRLTVESIKQAAILILNERGVAECGTEAIAERAGVSIGSLYQYFPNRESILSALYEDISLKYAETLKAQVPKILRMRSQKAVERIINMLFDMYDQNGVVLIQLVNEMPHMQLERQPFSFNNLAQSSVRAYLMRHLDATNSREFDRKAFFCTHMVLGCVSAYLREEQPGFSRKEFVRDLSRIVSGYTDNL